MSELLRTRFTFTEGSSDKEYIVQIQARDGGFVLLTYHGRRGSTLTETLKTKTPVEYEVAKKAFDKAVKERISKGYVADGADAGAVMVSGGEQPVQTGMIPHLLNVMTEADLEQAIEDDGWVMQEKHNGHRRGFALSASSTISANRKGFSVAYPSEVTDELASCCSSFFPLTVDGELIGTRYVIFDVREVCGDRIEALALETRLEHMESLRKALAAGGARNVEVVVTAYTAEDKRKLFERVKAEKGEGVVVKRRGTPYTPGKPASGGTHLKFPFLKFATAIVTSLHPTKSSIGISMLDSDGNLVSVGNCTIPANKSTPEIGALVEIRYLYAHKGGSLFQPVYQHEREDVSREECTLSTLHYKQGTPEDDDLAEAA